MPHDVRRIDFIQNPPRRAPCLAIQAVVLEMAVGHRHRAGVLDVTGVGVSDRAGWDGARSAGRGKRHRDSVSWSNAKITSSYSAVDSVAVFGPDGKVGGFLGAVEAGVEEVEPGGIGAVGGPLGEGINDGVT